MLHFHSFGSVSIDFGSQPVDLIQCNKLLAPVLPQKIDRNLFTKVSFASRLDTIGYNKSQILQGLISTVEVLLR